MKKMLYGKILFAHYVVSEGRFGISITFKTDDDFTFSSKDEYVADITGNYVRKERVLHKIYYCLLQTQDNELVELKDKRVKFSFEDGEFYDFWFIKEEE